MHESRLYSFLDNKNGFTIHFLEGQKLIHDIALLKELRGAGFAYYRDIVLSAIPMITFLKPQENFGFYIDSDEPSFKFKIEANHSGNLRTLIIPEDFNKFPDKITAIARFDKIMPNNTYNSVLDIKNQPTAEIINQVLMDSYQVQAKVKLGNMTDQSLLFVKLPPPEALKHQDNTPSLREYMTKNKQFILDTFDKNMDDIELIVQHFENAGHGYVASKEIKLHCQCSKERFIENLKSISTTDLNDLYQGDSFVEVKCDYCLKNYQIKRNELS